MMKKWVFLILTLSALSLYHEKILASEELELNHNIPVFSKLNLVDHHELSLKYLFRMLLSNQEGFITSCSWTKRIPESLPEGTVGLISHYQTTSEDIQRFEVTRDKFLYIDMRQLPEDSNAFLQACFCETYIDFLTIDTVIDVKRNINSNPLEKERALGEWIFARLRTMKTSIDIYEFQKSLNKIKAYFPCVNRLLTRLQELKMSDPLTIRKFNIELERLFGRSRMVEISIPETST